MTSKARSKTKPEKPAKSKSKAKPAPKKKTTTRAKLKAPAKVVKAKPKAKTKKPPSALTEPLRVIAPPLVQRPRRVSIGEALAQLTAATLDAGTAELTPFGLAIEAAITPSPPLASLLGPDARPLGVLIAALETWDGEGADLVLVSEARALLDAEPRDRHALESFVKRNCTL